MKSAFAVITLTLITLLTSGCATLIAPLSDRDIDRFHGKRTMGARIEDQAIEYKSLVNLRRDDRISPDARIVPTSWNGQVLLVGQVRSEYAREQAGKKTAAIRHVQHVHNELDIATRNSFLVRFSDGWTTFRVKGRLLFGPDVPGRRIKVVTESGVVYLMGLVNHVEAEQAVQSAKKAYGVQKIVKIFEYIDQPAP